MKKEALAQVRRQRQHLGVRPRQPFGGAFEGARRALEHAQTVRDESGCAAVVRQGDAWLGAFGQQHPACIPLLDRLDQKRRDLTGARCRSRTRLRASARRRAKAKDQGDTRCGTNERALAKTELPSCHPRTLAGRRVVRN